MVTSVEGVHPNPDKEVGGLDEVRMYLELK
jgi:hypothetical protein